MAKEIPHIDLSDYDSNEASREAFIETLGQGLREFGFLTVSGHGVDLQLIDDAYKAFQQLFALDDEQKQRYDASQDSTRGYTPFGREHAKDSPHPDLKEFWQVGQELPKDHPDYELFPPNIWPEELPQLRGTVVALYRSLESCASRLLEALALHFGLPDDTFSSMIQCGDSVLRSIHYPPLPQGLTGPQVRAAAHEDINLMTLLPQSQGSGLEIFTHEGQWLAVQPPPGALVVDTGDMMSRITNGVVPATTHRVINPDHESNESRFSMPFFVHPYPHWELKVLERFVSENQPPQFAPITARAFLQERLEQIGLRTT